MKLYQAVRLEKRLSKELFELNNKFVLNNCININELRDYEPNVLLEEIKKKSDELIKVRFLIERANLNIRELVFKNEEYRNMINLLKSTPTSMSNESINAYTRVELDSLIKGYEETIEKNKETIDYYNFVTDVNI